MKNIYLSACSPPYMVSPMDVAWAILKDDSPVEGHLERARGKAADEAYHTTYDRVERPLDHVFAGMDIEPKLMRPAVPSDSSEAREVREMVEGDSPQRRLDIFEQRVGRPPSDEEASKLVAEFRAGVPAYQSFSANYDHLDDLFE